MSNAEIIELVGGVVAIVLVGIEAMRTNVITLSEAAIAVLGIVFVLLAII